MYDFIIVGAGAAGCLLANRLTENPRIHVLLIEAGGEDSLRNIKIPFNWPELIGSSVDWRFTTTPQPHLNQRRLEQPRGKVWGGSSSLNAMVYTTGDPTVYEQWGGHNPGWRYADLAPYFPHALDNQMKATLPLQLPTARQPLADALLEAAQQAGFPRQTNLQTGGSGFGDYHATIAGGQRASAADVYLKPALLRNNLTLRSNAQMVNLLWDENGVIGVNYLQGENIKQVKAQREIILAAGAFGTPQMLLLSGIGPPAHLNRLGAPVRIPLAGVGENLQDHLNVSLFYQLGRGESLQTVQSAANQLKYRLGKRGPLAHSGFDSGGFVHTQGKDGAPDIQVLLYPHLPDEMESAGFRLVVVGVQPASRGRVRLQTTDALDAPRIDPAYLTAGSDTATLVAGLELGRRLVAQPAFSRFQPELRLAPADGDWAAYVTHQARSTYHPVGTCKMGPVGDSTAVVDSELRVHKLPNVRVIDASIMPRIPAGNPLAATLAIAEKGAELVLQAWKRS